VVLQLQLQLASKLHVSPVGQDLVTGWWHMIVVVQVQEESYTGKTEGVIPVAGAAGQDGFECCRSEPAENTGILTVNLLLRFVREFRPRQKEERPGRMLFRVSHATYSG
jgi:hypothetical protein